MCGKARHLEERRIFVTYKYRNLDSGMRAARNFDCARANIARVLWSLELIRCWLRADEDDVLYS